MHKVAWIGVRSGQRPDDGREAFALAALVAFAVGMSVGALAGRLVPLSEGEALVAALAPAAGLAAHEGALAFWLAAAAIATSGVALAWLCGLSVVGAPGALALPGLHGLGAGFAVALLWSVLGLPGLLAAAAGTVLPLAVLLPLCLIAAVEALAFARLAARVRLGARPSPVAGYARVGAWLALGALGAAACEAAVVRPLLALALRVSGL